jgi:hypothetical protein
MTPTEAILLLYRQNAMRKEFPVELRVPNSLTAEVLTKSDKNIEVKTLILKKISFLVGKINLEIISDISVQKGHQTTKEKR